MIKKPLAYISAAWSGTETENMEAARRYCRAVYEAVKNEIAVAQRLNITATTLDGILTVKGQGETGGAVHE